MSPSAESEQARLARIEAGVATEADLAHSDAPVVTEQVEDVAEEVEDLSEQLALQSIITDEKHEEVLECLHRLEQSLTTENPSLAAIQKELLEIRSELVNLKSSMVSTPSSRTPSESPVTSEESHVEPVLVESTEELKPEETPKVRKHRMI